MNLLFLDSIEKETYGGMEEWIRLVADGLSGRGHNVTVGGRKDSQFLQRVKNESPKVNLLELEISGDFNPITISKLKKFVESSKIDIVTVNFNKDVRLGGLAARWAGKTKVVWSLGLDITSDKWIHRNLTPKLIDMTFVPSAALKNQVTRLGYLEQEKVEVIPIGIPPLKTVLEKEKARKQLLADYNLPSDSIVAVTSGRFVEQKGHKYLVDAIPTILKSHPQMQFLFLGDGPLKPDLQNQIQKLQLEKHLIFAGMLQDVNPILLGADLMIHPSVEEPFGIAILEGMRAGLPVVASKVGGIPEVVKEDSTAILVESRNSSKLARSIIELVSDSLRMSEFGLMGRKRWKEKFSVDMMLERVEEKYLEVVSSEKING